MKNWDGLRGASILMRYTSLIENGYKSFAAWRIVAAGGILRRFSPNMQNHQKVS
jgi:hypothetical protein